MARSGQRRGRDNQITSPFCPTPLAHIPPHTGRDTRVLAAYNACSNIVVSQCASPVCICHALAESRVPRVMHICKAIRSRVTATRHFSPRRVTSLIETFCGGTKCILGNRIKKKRKGESERESKGKRSRNKEKFAVISTLIAAGKRNYRERDINVSAKKKELL